ncbi:MAG: type I-D CRISPR-associated helicase Cas3' [Fimbriimonadia bacterium]|nr:type I-D CRISPR-associated helicase Cas3' [Fimbriimonadia bacterium]
MIIKGYRLPQVEIPGIRTRLYPHQAAMLQAWENNKAFLLITKTGSGKTRATALPVLRHGESAVFVYPTNALIVDQARAIKQLMDDEAVSYREWTPHNATEKFGEEEYLLVQINADSLRAFAKSWGMSEKQKGAALLKLLQQDKRKIVLINPDILFLIYSLRYGASHEALAHLQAYKTVVFDEFHLYCGVELAHVLFLIHLAKQMHAFQRVVLLSATPNEEVQTYLDRLLNVNIIDSSAPASQPICGERTVAHDVTLLPLLVSTEPVAVIREKILQMVDELRKLRELNQVSNISGEYTPCIVILNSAVSAIALEDTLVDHGISRSDIAPIRGLSARSSRDTKGKLIVLGTSAIEVGIDFQTDYLLFEAGDSASFMQRFGRVGRHKPGAAFLIGSYRECQSLISGEEEISRDSLESKAKAIYPQHDTKTWFVNTLSGAFTILAQANNFRKRIEEDGNADSKIKERIAIWQSEMLKNYAEIMQLTELQRAIQKEKRKPLWLQHYEEINTFRTSLPSQEVWDLNEREADREWRYEADVKTLLTRAERLWFNEKHGRLYVKGYGKYHRVWFAKSFEDEREEDCCGIFRTTADYSSQEMQFFQEGHLTSVSHVMAKPKHHVFVLAPRDLSSQLDWRLAWFPCGSPSGKYIIAFDGDALLLKEVYNRCKR